MRSQDEELKEAAMPLLQLMRQTPQDRQAILHAYEAFSERFSSHPAWAKISQLKLPRLVKHKQQSHDNINKSTSAWLGYYLPRLAIWKQTDSQRHQTHGQGPESAAHSHRNTPTTHSPAASHISRQQSAGSGHASSHEGDMAALQAAKALLQQTKATDRGAAVQGYKDLKAAHPVWAEWVCSLSHQDLQNWIKTSQAVMKTQAASCRQQVMYYLTQLEAWARRVDALNTARGRVSSGGGQGPAADTATPGDSTATAAVIQTSTGVARQSAGFTHGYPAVAESCGYPNTSTHGSSYIHPQASAYDYQHYYYPGQYPTTGYAAATATPTAAVASQQLGYSRWHQGACRGQHSPLPAPDSQQGELLMRQVEEAIAQQLQVAVERVIGHQVINNKEAGVLPQLLAIHREQQGRGTGPTRPARASNGSPASQEQGAAAEADSAEQRQQTDQQGTGSTGEQQPVLLAVPAHVVPQLSQALAGLVGKALTPHLLSVSERPQTPPHQHTAHNPGTGLTCHQPVAHSSEADSPPRQPSPARAQHPLIPTVTAERAAPATVTWQASAVVTEAKVGQQAAATSQQATPPQAVTDLPADATDVTCQQAAAPAAEAETGQQAAALSGPAPAVAHLPGGVGAVAHLPGGVGVVAHLPVGVGAVARPSIPELFAPGPGAPQGQQVPADAAPEDLQALCSSLSDPGCMHGPSPRQLSSPAPHPATAEPCQPGATGHVVLATVAGMESVGEVPTQAEGHEVAEATDCENTAGEHATDAATEELTNTLWAQHAAAQLIAKVRAQRGPSTAQAPVPGSVVEPDSGSPPADAELQASPRPANQKPQRRARQRFRHTTGSPEPTAAPQPTPLSPAAASVAGRLKARLQEAYTQPTVPELPAEAVLEALFPPSAGTSARELPAELQPAVAADQRPVQQPTVAEELSTAQQPLLLVAEQLPAGLTGQEGTLHSGHASLAVAALDAGTERAMAQPLPQPAQAQARAPGGATSAARVTHPTPSLTVATLGTPFHNDDTTDACLAPPLAPAAPAATPVAAALAEPHPDALLDQQPQPVHTMLPQPPAYATASAPLAAASSILAPAASGVLPDAAAEFEPEVDTTQGGDACDTEVVMIDTLPPATADSSGRTPPAGSGVRLGPSASPQPDVSRAQVGGPQEDEVVITADIPSQSTTPGGPTQPGAGGARRTSGPGSLPARPSVLRANSTVLAGAYFVQTARLSGQAARTPPGASPAGVFVQVRPRSAHQQTASPEQPLQLPAPQPQPPQSQHPPMPQTQQPQQKQQLQPQVPEQRLHAGLLEPQPQRQGQEQPQLNTAVPATTVACGLAQVSPAHQSETDSGDNPLAALLGYTDSDSESQGHSASGHPGVGTAGESDTGRNHQHTDAARQQGCFTPGDGAVASGAAATQTVLAAAGAASAQGAVDMINSALPQPGDTLPQPGDTAPTLHAALRTELMGAASIVVAAPAVTEAPVDAGGALAVPPAGHAGRRPRHFGRRAPVLSCTDTSTDAVLSACVQGQAAHATGAPSLSGVPTGGAGQQQALELPTPVNMQPAPAQEQPQPAPSHTARLLPVPNFNLIPRRQSQGFAQEAAEHGQARPPEAECDTYAPVTAEAAVPTSPSTAAQPAVQHRPAPVPLAASVQEVRAPTPATRALAAAAALAAATTSGVSAIASAGEPGGATEQGAAALQDAIARGLPASAVDAPETGNAAKRMAQGAGAPISTALPPGEQLAAQQGTQKPAKPKRQAIRVSTDGGKHAMVPGQPTTRSTRTTGRQAADHEASPPIADAQPEQPAGTAEQVATAQPEHDAADEATGTVRSAAPFPTEATVPTTEESAGKSVKRKPRTEAASAAGAALQHEGSAGTSAEQTVPQMLSGTVVPQPPVVADNPAAAVHAPPQPAGDDPHARAARHAAAPHAATRETAAALHTGLHPAPVMRGPGLVSDHDASAPVPPAAEPATATTADQLPPQPLAAAAGPSRRPAKALAGKKAPQRGHSKAKDGKAKATPTALPAGVARSPEHSMAVQPASATQADGTGLARAQTATTTSQRQPAGSRLASGVRPVRVDGGSLVVASRDVQSGGVASPTPLRSSWPKTTDTWLEGCTLWPEGLELLKQWLQAQGVDLPTGWEAYYKERAGSKGHRDPYYVDAERHICKSKPLVYQFLTGQLLPGKADGSKQGSGAGRKQAFGRGRKHQALQGAAQQAGLEGLRQWLLQEHDLMLPDGWQASQVQHTGSQSASWYYISPHGHRCRSRPDVLKYLQATGGMSGDSKAGTPAPASQEEGPESDDDLPVIQALAKRRKLSLQACDVTMPAAQPQEPAAVAQAGPAVQPEAAPALAVAGAEQPAGRAGAGMTAARLSAAAAAMRSTSGRASPAASAAAAMVTLPAGSSASGATGAVGNMAPRQSTVLQGAAGKGTTSGKKTKRSPPAKAHAADAQPTTTAVTTTEGPLRAGSLGANRPANLTMERLGAAAATMKPTSGRISPAASGPVPAASGAAPSASGAAPAVGVHASSIGHPAAAATAAVSEGMAPGIAAVTAQHPANAPPAQPPENPLPQPPSPIHHADAAHQVVQAAATTRRATPALTTAGRVAASSALTALAFGAVTAPVLGVEPGVAPGPAAGHSLAVAAAVPTAAANTVPVVYDTAEHSVRSAGLRAASASVTQAHQAAVAEQQPDPNSAGAALLDCTQRVMAVATTAGAETDAGVVGQVARCDVVVAAEVVSGPVEGPSTAAAQLNEAVTAVGRTASESASGHPRHPGGGSGSTRQSGSSSVAGAGSRTGTQSTGNRSCGSTVERRLATKLTPLPGARRTPPRLARPTGVAAGVAAASVAGRQPVAGAGSGRAVGAGVMRFVAAPVARASVGKQPRVVQLLPGRGVRQSGSSTEAGAHRPAAVAAASLGQHSQQHAATATTPAPSGARQALTGSAAGVTAGMDSTTGPSIMPHAQQLPPTASSPSANLAKKRAIAGMQGVLSKRLKVGGQGESASAAPAGRQGVPTGGDMEAAAAAAAVVAATAAARAAMAPTDLPVAVQANGKPQGTSATADEAHVQGQVQRPGQDTHRAAVGGLLAALGPEPQPAADTAAGTTSEEAGPVDLHQQQPAEVGEWADNGEADTTGDVAPARARAARKHRLMELRRPATATVTVARGVATVQAATARSQARADAASGQQHGHMLPETAAAGAAPAAAMQLGQMASTPSVGLVQAAVAASSAVSGGPAAEGPAEPAAAVTVASAGATGSQDPAALPDTEAQTPRQAAESGADTDAAATGSDQADGSQTHAAMPGTLEPTSADAKRVKATGPEQPEEASVLDAAAAAAAPLHVPLPEAECAALAAPFAAPVVAAAPAPGGATAAALPNEPPEGQDGTVRPPAATRTGQRSAGTRGRATKPGNTPTPPLSAAVLDAARIDGIPTASARVSSGAAAVVQDQLLSNPSPTAGHSAKRARNAGASAAIALNGEHEQQPRQEPQEPQAEDGATPDTASPASGDAGATQARVRAARQRSPAGMALKTSGTLVAVGVAASGTVVGQGGRPLKRLRPNTSAAAAGSASPPLPAHAGVRAAGAAVMSAVRPPQPGAAPRVTQRRVQGKALVAATAPTPSQPRTRQRPATGAQQEVGSPPAPARQGHPATTAYVSAAKPVAELAPWELAYRRHHAAVEHDSAVADLRRARQRLQALEQEIVHEEQSPRPDARELARLRTCRETAVKTVEYEEWRVGMAERALERLDAWAEELNSQGLGLGLEAHAALPAGQPTLLLAGVAAGSARLVPAAS